MANNEEPMENPRNGNQNVSPEQRQYLLARFYELPMQNRYFCLTLEDWRKKLAEETGLTEEQIILFFTNLLRTDPAYLEFLRRKRYGNQYHHHELDQDMDTDENSSSTDSSEVSSDSMGELEVHSGAEDSSPEQDDVSMDTIEAPIETNEPFSDTNEAAEDFNETPLDTNDASDDSDSETSGTDSSSDWESRTDDESSDHETASDKASHTSGDSNGSRWDDTDVTLLVDMAHEDETKEWLNQRMADIKELPVEEKIEIIDAAFHVKTVAGSERDDIVSSDHEEDDEEYDDLEENIQRYREKLERKCKEAGAEAMVVRMSREERTAKEIRHGQDEENEKCQSVLHLSE